MLAVIAIVFLILGLVGILSAHSAVLWALLFIALGIALGSWPLGGVAPWQRTQP